MLRTRITPELDKIPELFHRLLADAPVYDSSCSPDARVLYVDRDSGFYLKSAPAGSASAEGHPA